MILMVSLKDTKYPHVNDNHVHLIAVLRVEWFRSRERHTRWGEELVHLKRDMVMSYRSFKTYQEIWAFKARSDSNSVGMRAYALGRSDFFRRLADQLLTTCLKHIKVRFFIPQYSS